ncbi:MAG TPA: transposase [Gammaproteobacteria bacterium]
MRGSPGSTAHLHAGAGARAGRGVLRAAAAGVANPPPHPGPLPPGKRGREQGLACRERYSPRISPSSPRSTCQAAGAAWLKLLLQHVPDRGEHLVRYYGWYSNRCRGLRAAQAAASPGSADSEAVDEELSRAARSSWARLLRKVYEVEALTCPHCGGEMRVIAVIEEAPVIERILRHVGVWEPTPPLRAPPEEAWPTGSQIPLTYHPVPDIA